MRVFISLRLSKEAVEEVKRIQKDLKGSGFFEGKLTEEENLHLTLKFLGEIDEDKVEEVRERLRKINLGGFNAKFGEIGVFDKNYIRIIWVKLLGCEELQRQVDIVLGGLFEKEKRFMGHLTIVRVKKIRDKKEFLEFVNKIKVKDVKFQVNGFGLMKSELFPKGPRYEIIEEFNL
jgi:2'-5' RNA ligase